MAADRTAIGPSVDEIHITLDQFEDEITYEPDGTAVLFGGAIRHRCPDGTACAALASRNGRGQSDG